MIVLDQHTVYCSQEGLVALGSQGIGVFTIIHVCCCSMQWEIARSLEIGIAECSEVLWPYPVTGMGKFWKLPTSSQSVKFPPSCWGPEDHHLEPLGAGTIDGC